MLAPRYIPVLMPRHPLVVVTATTRPDDGRSRVRLSTAYLQAVEAVGLTPLIVAPSACVQVDDILDVASGLVLTGGEDVDPIHFGATPHPKLGTVHAARDATELALIEGARARQIPILAICRGIQVLNVALGGTLIQDIPSEHPSAIAHDSDLPRDRRTHTVQVTPDSRLARAIGRDALLVNSFHHQAIASRAPTLVETAVAPDGLIEAVETPQDNPWWVIGIQWHPEDLVRSPEPWDRALFKAFAGVVAETPAGGPS
jgi:putative glutamine amidotransferase